MAVKGIIIVGLEEKHSSALCTILEDANYETLSVGSLPDTLAHVQERTYGALIIDLDHGFLDNRLLKELRAKLPSLCFIGLSSRSFHPELEEALSRHIDACFTKSAGYEDLLYWLKAVFDPPILKGRKVESPEDRSRERP